jgi:hypothetical protein
VTTVDTNGPWTGWRGSAGLRLGEFGWGQVDRWMAMAMADYTAVRFYSRSDGILDGPSTL